MPEFKITSPEGATYKITAPEGASEQDAVAYVQEQLAAVPELMERELSDSLSLDQKKQLVNLRKSGIAPMTQSVSEAELGKQTVAGMSGGEKFMAGMGKGFSDLGTGVAQLTGFADQKEIDDAKQRDAALMDSGAGFAGNIAGNVAAFAPAMFIPGVNTYAGATALGAGMGFLQPTASNDSRVLNTVLGGVGGAGGQLAGRGLAAGFKGTGAAVSPFLKGGRNKIVGRFLRDAVGDKADDVMARMANAKQMVPGSPVLSRDVAQNAPISRITQGLQSNNPQFAQSLADITKAQNTARVGALQNIIPDEAAARALRSATTKPLIRPLKTARLTKSQGQEMVRPVENLLKSMKRGDAGQTMPGIIDDVANKLKGVANSPELNKAEKLYGVRKYVSSLINKKGPTGAPENEAVVRELMAIQRKIDGSLRRTVPEYGKYMSNYREMSKPINQAKTLEELVRKSTSPLDDSIRPTSLAKNIRDDRQLVKSATGFKRNKGLEGTLSPDQLATVRNVMGDVSRSAEAGSLGKIPGSNTAQDLATQNILKRAGIPQMLADNPLIRTAMRPINFAYKVPEQMTQDVLAEAMVNPQFAAQLMRDASVPVTLKQEIAKALTGAAGMSLPAGLLAQ